jgi:tetratricopeptide (TPR) repeat protein
MSMARSLAAAAALATAAALVPAQAAVTVFGGGLARDCYEAVEGRAEPISRAMQVCDLALQEEELTRKNRAATHVNRGILFMRQGRNERALADFDSGLRLKPDLHEAEINRGAALYNLKRFEEAEAAIEIGLQTEDAEARAIGLYNRALLRERRGDVTGAYYDFLAASELSPDFTQAGEQLKRFTVERVSG